MESLARKIIAKFVKKPTAELTSSVADILNDENLNSKGKASEICHKLEIPLWINRAAIRAIIELNTNNFKK